MSNSQTLEVADSPGSRSTYLPWRLRKPGNVLDAVVNPIVPTFSHAGQVALPLIPSVWLLIACKTIIGIVSALDTYLTLKYAVSLHSPTLSHRCNAVERVESEELATACHLATLS